MSSLCSRYGNYERELRFNGVSLVACMWRKQSVIVLVSWCRDTCDCEYVRMFLIMNDKVQNIWWSLSGHTTVYNDKESNASLISCCSIRFDPCWLLEMAFHSESDPKMKKTNQFISDETMPDLETNYIARLWIRVESFCLIDSDSIQHTSYIWRYEIFNF